MIKSNTGWELVPVSPLEAAVTGLLFCSNSIVNFILLYPEFKYVKAIKWWIRVLMYEYIVHSFGFNAVSVTLSILRMLSWYFQLRRCLLILFFQYGRYSGYFAFSRILFFLFTTFISWMIVFCFVVLKTLVSGRKCLYFEMAY